MRIKRLILNDFLSWKQADISFNSSGVLALKGTNRDGIDGGSNGSGKSALQQALEYVIKGSSSRKVRSKELIREKDVNKACICVEIECEERKEILYIERIIYRNSSDKVLLYLNKDGDKKQVLREKVSDCEDFIFSWLGIERGDISTWILINERSWKSFLSLSDREKIDEIAKLSSFSRLNSWKEVCDKDIRDLENKIQSLFQEKEKTEGQIIELESSKITLNELLKDSKQRFENETLSLKNDIISLQKDVNDKSVLQRELYNQEVEKSKKESEQLDVLRENIQQLHEKIADLREKITLKSDELSVLRRESLSDCEQKLSKIDQRLNAEEFKKKDSLSRIETLRSRLNSETITCPKCGEKFLLSDESISSIELTIESLIEEGETAKKIIDRLLEGKCLYDQKRRKLVEQLSVFEEVIKLDESLIQKIMSTQINPLNQKIKSLELNRTQFQSASEKMSVEIEAIKTEIKLKENILERKFEDSFSEKIINAENKIKSLREKISYCDIDLNTLQKRRDNFLVWLKEFPRFRAYLANQSLSILENNINYYLKLIKADIFCKLEGFRTKADGTLKEQVSVFVERGGTLWSFESCSKGERARIELATLLALRLARQETGVFEEIKMLWVDEVLEGIDSSGLYSIIEGLKDLDLNLILTTHVDVSTSFGTVLEVIKENGISFIN